MKPARPPIDARGSLLPALLLAALLCPAGALRAEITGSMHDFSSLLWSGDRICAPCHTPHNADTSMSNAPLWNHEVTTATYVIYGSPTMIGTPGQPGPDSKLCLSCHDGTVAVDSFGGMTGSDFIPSTGLIGTDLSDDHPIGLYWGHQTIGTSGNLINCWNCHNSGYTLKSNRLRFSLGPQPGNRYIECSTCHDPHDKNPGYGKMLRVDNANSGLCLFCHKK